MILKKQIIIQEEVSDEEKRQVKGNGERMGKKRK